MKRLALACATVICVAMIAAVLLSDLFLRPGNPQAAEEWDLAGGIVLGITGSMVLTAFFSKD